MTKNANYGQNLAVFGPKIQCPEQNGDATIDV